MTAKQQILAKYPKSYCIKQIRPDNYFAYAEPYDGVVWGVGNTAVEAWRDLLSILQKENEI